MNLEDWIKANYTPIYDNGSWQDFIAVYDVRELFAGKKLVDKDAVVVSADDLRVMLFGPVNSERGEKIARRLGAIQQLESALSASEVKP